MAKRNWRLMPERSAGRFEPISCLELAVQAVQMNGLPARKGRALSASLQPAPSNHLWVFSDRFRRVAR